MARQAKQVHRFPILLVVAIFLLLHGVFLVELGLDLMQARSHASHAGGLSAMDLWRALEGSATMARGSATAISRAYNVLISIFLSSIAIAVPLTANLYTPKLLDLFIRNRINVATLSFFVFSAAHSLWTTHATWDVGPLGERGFYPRLSLWVTFETMMLGWSLLIPYFYFMFSFLNPGRIIARVSAELTRSFERIPATDGAALRRLQLHVDQWLLHLGNIILRAIDRSDRDVALDAIHALERVLGAYQGKKPALPAAWFEITGEQFVGLSGAAVEIIRRERIWVEHKGLHQLELAHNAALAKMQDAISAVSDVDRRIAHAAAAHGDGATLHLCVRYFNNFLREATKRKDVHAIFDVFQKYKELAHELFEGHSALTLAIARHIGYYAELGRLSGLHFIYELAAYDLGSVLESVGERDGTARAVLVELLLGFGALPGSVRLVKAKLIAGGYLHAHGFLREAARVREHLGAVPQPLLGEAVQALLQEQDPIFWEVTDRQVNIDYVGAERRQAIREFMGQEFMEELAEGRPEGAPSLH